MENIIRKNFKNKKILITGNTGFKGSWLSFWMQNCGAKVFGISKGEVSKPSFFSTLNLKKTTKYHKLDIKNFKKLNKCIKKIKPDYIFHLAAEAIVKDSFLFPKKAWDTNTIGTINILECLKNYNRNIIAVLITSDKVYRNLEINRGYNEKDFLGGFDPYSASKASADLAIQSYFHSFLNKKNKIKICIARAGNVIGGGDWATGRIIPDCIKQWSSSKKVKIRNPNSTRPWQHVLDVLYGYICLAVKMKKDNSLNGEAFNFGPKIENKKTVLQVVKEMKKNWTKVNWTISNNKNFKESKLLQLNSIKAKKTLNWKCKLNFEETIKLTVQWYKTFYFDKKEIFKVTRKQLFDFEKLI